MRPKSFNDSKEFRVAAARECKSGDKYSELLNILLRKNILDIHVQNVSLLLKNNKLKDLPIQLCLASFCLPCALGGSSVFLYKLPLSFFFLERSLIQASYFTLCLFREHEARV